MTFKEWMHAVDQEVYSRVDMSVHDLPDAAFRDMYDGGSSAEQAAEVAIEGAFEGFTLM